MGWKLHFHVCDRRRIRIGPSHTPWTKVSLGETETLDPINKRLGLGTEYKGSKKELPKLGNTWKIQEQHIAWPCSRASAFLIGPRVTYVI